MLTSPRAFTLIYRADVGINPYNTNYRDAEGGGPYKFSYMGIRNKYTPFSVM